MRYIYLLPLGEVEKDLLEFLKEALEEKFGMELKVTTNLELPHYAYNEGREQHHSTSILNELKKVLPNDSLKVLGITPVDIYVPSLNFVFGEAEMEGRLALISLYRLYPEFYGLRPNENILQERMLKEAVHELGHTFGLTHCVNSFCVMHFSNSIKDTDFKKEVPCTFCQRKLEFLLKRVQEGEF